MSAPILDEVELSALRRAVRELDRMGRATPAMLRARKKLAAIHEIKDLDGFGDLTVAADGEVCPAPKQYVSLKKQRLMSREEE